MSHYFKNIWLLLVSILFLLFGIHVLLSAYRLNDPYAFIMTFFASNLIILISAAMALAFAIRLKRPRGGPPAPDERGGQPPLG